MTNIVKYLSDEAITIKASSFRSDAHDFTLMAYINCASSITNPNSEDLPSSNYLSKRGTFAWKKGQVIRLEKTEFPNKKWDNCELYIVLDAVDSGEYHIVA
jgi:hypothetical protein